MNKEGYGSELKGDIAAYTKVRKNESTDICKFSTTTSYQSCDSLSPSDKTFIKINSNSSKLIIDNSVNNLKELNSLNNKEAILIPKRVNENKELKLEILKNIDNKEISENRNNKPINLDNNKNGIKILYTNTNMNDTEDFLELNNINLQFIYVNGNKCDVVPIIDDNKDLTKKMPEYFKNCEELVRYFTGKVIRSFRSLYYIKKKLQQALYGAVFLAYRLKISKNKNLNKLEGNNKFINLNKEKYTINNNCELLDNSTLMYEFDENNNMIAIKILNLNLRKKKPSLMEDINAEVSFAKLMIKHKNIVEYDEIWQDNFKNTFIKMPYAEYDDLFEVMRRRNKPLTENEARWLFRQICYAVQHLHNNGIAMRDLSLENILMFSEKNNINQNVIYVMKPGDSIIIPKIADPGQACKIKSINKNIKIDNFQRNNLDFLNDNKYDLQKVEFLFGKSFRPPEAYEINTLYDATKVDVFCLGWMLLYTLTKFQPFETCRMITKKVNTSNRNIGFLNNLFEKLLINSKNLEYNGKSVIAKDPNWGFILAGKYSELYKKIHATKLSSDVLNLIENMLQPNYEKRYCISSVISHPWMKCEELGSHKTCLPLMASTLTKRQDIYKVIKIENERNMNKESFKNIANIKDKEKIDPKTIEDNNSIIELKFYSTKSSNTNSNITTSIPTINGINNIISLKNGPNTINSLHNIPKSPINNKPLIHERKMNNVLPKINFEKIFDQRYMFDNIKKERFIQTQRIGSRSLLKVSTNKKLLLVESNNSKPTSFTNTFKDQEDYFINTRTFRYNTTRLQCPPINNLNTSSPNNLFYRTNRYNLSSSSSITTVPVRKNETQGILSNIWSYIVNNNSLEINNKRK
ncbi:protein kinase domain-containing protein [Cryptosporidium andersoni]|uniref:Protein kinase domain-containing protein n=1 Tax=Cryptosporidium andersoni TaxID=117008 RepID=A0A1J4MQX1_9CRYT|nr:protein kinase domain-containing protein [Cryptosporidium andersoni]